MDRDNWTCVDCGVQIVDTPEMHDFRMRGGDLWGKMGNHMTIDHIIPKGVGGTNQLTNLVTMCYICNNGKGSGLHKTNPPGQSRRNRRKRERDRARRLEYLRSKSPLVHVLDPEAADRITWNRILGGAYKIR